MGLIRLLLKEGSDIDFQGTIGLGVHIYTALHCAVMFGKEEVAKLLLEEGADVNTRCFDGCTPLHIAARGDKSGRMVRMLLEMGADYRIRNSNMQTALHVAVLYRNENSLKVLLEKGMDINERDNKQMMPLHLAFLGVAPVSYAMINMLVGSGADVSAQDWVGQSPLYLAARDGLGDVVALILAHGGVAGDFGGGLHLSGQTALHAAAASGNEGVVKQLLEKGVGGGLASRDYDGYTALDHVVIKACRVDKHNTDCKPMVDLLLQKGPKIYTLKTLNNVLLWAAEKGHEDIFSLLLESGAEVSCQHSSISWVRVDGRVGDTVLHVAAEYGQAAIVRILLEKGARINIMNRLGKTPLDLALRSGGKVKDYSMKEEVVKVLRDNGAKTAY